MLETVFLRNAWVRALLPLALMVLVGVSSSALVAETTAGNSVRWRLMPRTFSFYVILGAVLASTIYQVAIARYDKELARGFTPKQYEARIRNRVAEDVAKRSRKLIRDGKIEQLEKETESFKKLYGEGVR